jgi:glycerol-3-phosphate acyltransferase PlsY
MRNLGIIGFVATFILDAGKGLLAVLLASKMTSENPTWVATAACAAVLGHCFPVWLRFHGGKGVATGVGVFIAVAPVQVILVLAIFAVTVAIWRYVSLGSIVATAAFPVLVYLMKHPPIQVVLGAAGAAAIIIARHHANIARLLKGTENKLGRKKAESGRQKAEGSE